MPSLNKVLLIGHLGKDPELRYAPSGTAIATFSLATNSRQKASDGEWVDKTEWHNIITFNKKAEFAGEYLKKGAAVFVEGRLQTSSWEDSEGNKKYKTEVVADQLNGLGKNDNKTQAENKTQTQNTAPPPAADDDDLPF